MYAIRSYYASAARAIANGATRVERIDLLVLNLLREHGINDGMVVPIVELIEQRLGANV